MPDPMAEGAHAALRAATGAAHLRLHAIPVFQALAAGRITRAAYAGLLRRKLGFHAALDGRLAEVPGLEGFGIDLAARSRTHLLRADIAWLGAEPDAPCAPLMTFRSPAAALGGLYVAEGSTLGGRQLALALDGILPPGPDGRRFLLGHGERHGEMWRDFCAAIERCGTAPAARAGLVQGALSTFATFESWFTTAPAEA